MEDFFEDKSRKYLVLELCDGDLFDYLDERHFSLEEEEQVDILKQITSGVNYLHSIGICHRDLKLENIMISMRDGQPVLKIADFGMSALLEVGQKMKGVAGTIAYCAPEIFSHKEYTSEVDVWSLGVISFILCTGFMPVNPFNEKTAIENIIHGLVKVPQEHR